jgi:hypothetical protein
LGVACAGSPEHPFEVNPLTHRAPDRQLPAQALHDFQTRVGAILIVIAGVSIAAQSALGDLPLALIYVTWVAAGFGVGLAMLHLTNWAISYSPAAQSGASAGRHRPCAWSVWRPSAH